MRAQREKVSLTDPLAKGIEEANRHKALMAVRVQMMLEQEQREEEEEIRKQEEALAASFKQKPKK